MSLAQPLSQLVAAIGAVLGLAGYVYLIGAAVLWARLRDAGLPTEVPISVAIRPEMAVLGAETLVVWVGFVGVMLLLLGSAMRVRRHEVWLAVASGLWGAGVGVALWAALAAGNPWPSVLALIAGAPLVAVAAAAWPPTSWILAAVLPALAAGVSGYGTSALLQYHHGLEVGLAWATATAIVVTALVLRSSFVRRRRGLTTLSDLEHQRDALAAWARDYGEGSDERQELLRQSQKADELAAEIRTRLRAPRDQGSRTVWHWWQWGALAAIALPILGALAVVHEVNSTSDFNAALVSLNTGRCVTGTYVARDGSDVIVGGTVPVKVAGVVSFRKRVVVIPDREVLELQVRAPRRGLQELRVLPQCAPTAVVTPDGSSSERFRGPRGPQGVAGPQGPAGPQGKTGQPGDNTPGITVEGLAVYAGYADSLRKGTSNRSSPWKHATRVVFKGCNYFHPDRCPENSDGTDRYDSGAIRIVNRSDASTTVTDASVVIGTCTFRPWPGLNVVLSAGKQLILVQTGGEPPCHTAGSEFNFDTSQTNTSSTKCTVNDGNISVFQVTVDGHTLTYKDTKQILNTGGKDPGANVCGNHNETRAWAAMSWS